MPTENRQSACEGAVAFGIDLSLLIDNLRFNPEQRIERHDHALTIALALRQTMIRAKHQTISQRSTKHIPSPCPTKTQAPPSHA